MLRHPEVRYEVTDHCNAHCIMCPREKHDRRHGIMELGKFKKSLDEVVGLGAKSIVLTGFGEPLLDRGLEYKIEYCKTHDLNTYIITNASALTQTRSRGLLNAGLDEMRVSFYGMGPDTYNGVMQGLDYYRTVSGLLDFIDMATDYDCKIQLSYLVLPENEADTDLFRQYWEPLVDYIEIWKPHNFGDGKDYRERSDCKTTCGRPENGPLQIQWDGTVIPCCYDYNNQIVLGNAFDQPVMEILAGEPYQRLREAHRSGNFGEFPYCDQCDQLLPHSDALVYTNRHNLPPEEAVKLSNTDLYNLIDDEDFSRIS